MLKNPYILMRSFMLSLMLSLMLSFTLSHRIKDTTPMLKDMDKLATFPFYKSPAETRKHVLKEAEFYKTLVK